MKKLNKIKFKHIGGVHTDPFQMIATLFDAAAPSYYKQFVSDILLYSSQKEAYTEPSLHNMLYTLKEIKLFVKAVYAIQLSKYKSPLLVSSHDLFEPKYYIDPKDKTKHWQLRPVALTKEEYKNPYWVFEMIYI